VGEPGAELSDAVPASSGQVLGRLLGFVRLRFTGSNSIHVGRQLTPGPERWSSTHRYPVLHTSAR
jgi:hypothetical protein